MTSVAVVGVGSVGGFFAAHAVAAGHDVTLCVRTRFDELVVESIGDVFRSRPRIVVEPAEAPQPEWVLLATKAHQTEGARDWLRAFDRAGTRIVVIQNGVEHRDRLRPLVAEAEIVPTVVYCGAEAIAPGHIVHRRNGFLIVEDGAAARGLTEMYEGTRASIRATSDWTSAAWRKLCANVVANGITAITGERSTVMRRPDIQRLGRELVRECAAVARAEGAHLDDDIAEQVASQLAGSPEASGTSMLYDRLAGRPLEHDAIYGAVVRAGIRHGIPTPLSETMAALLSAVSDASRADRGRPGPPLGAE
jgi:2-dehydropantoate 2-reductase